MAGAPPPFEIQVENAPTYLFSDTVPSEFSASSGGRLSIDDGRYKSGGSSLRWDWSQPGASVTYRHEDAFKYLTGRDPDPIVYEWITFTRLSTFAIWVHNLTPVQEVLWFEIGDGTSVHCRFWMRLDFQGWRQCRAMYGRDIEPLGGFPDQETANTLRILAPEGVDSGTLWFDEFCPRSEEDVRMVRPTRQVPWVRPLESRIEHDDFVKGRWTEDEVEEPPRMSVEVPLALTRQQRATIDRIRREAVPWWEVPSPAAVNAEALEGLRTRHRSHGFVRREGTLSGSVGQPRAFWGHAEQIAAAYWRAARQPEVQADVLRLFNDFADLCIDQGHGAGYSLRTGFARPLWLMRDPLKQSGRWRPLLERLRKIVSIRDFYNPEATANADVYNTLLWARLQVVLLEEDERLVYRDLLAFRHWLERTAEWGEIRPDGSFFHHNQTYNGYNLPAIGPWVNTLYLLRDSEFFAPVSHLYAYRTVFAMHWYSCIEDIPHSLSGRWRRTGRIGKGHALLCRQLADMGTPEGFDPARYPLPDTWEAGNPDPMMAAIYLYYASQHDTDDEWTRRYRSLGIEAAPTDGHLTLNYTVAGIHRRDDWMVFFRGQRHPFFSGESYGFQAGNTMGRYLNYGHMAILSRGNPTNAADSGWNPPEDSMGGWNANFWPGTTTREIPFEALRSPFDVEEWMTAETFAVGTQLAGNGVFGLRLREDELHTVDPTRLGPVKYWLGNKEYRRRIEASMIDTAFRACKAVFCFEDRILCLGSGIRASDPAHRVVTTLLQHHLSPECRQRFRLSTELENGPFPLTARLDDPGAVWLVDSIGNGYYIPAQNPPIEIQRRRQSLPYHTHTSQYRPELNERIDANEGETELVLLDHGPAPTDAAYEYCILIRADGDRMAQFAETMTDPRKAPYRVLANNPAAQIVFDRPSRTAAYVIYQPHLADTVTADDSLPLIAVDRPCVLMTTHLDDRRLVVSIADPELGLAADGTRNAQAPHPEGTVIHLAVRDQWRLDARHAQVDAKRGLDNTTLLRITCRDLMPVVTTLVRAEDHR